MLVGRDLPGRGVYRTMFFLPYVLSEVNTAIMWMLLYNPDPERGFLNAILVLIPGVKPVAWLGDMKHRTVCCVYRSDMEILWFSHVAVFNRLTKHSYRD